MTSHDSQGSPLPTSPRDHSSESFEDVDNPALDLLSLSRAVKARKAEYTRRRNVRLKVGSWNVAAIAGTEHDIGKWFVQGEGVLEMEHSRRRQESSSTHGEYPSESAHHSTEGDSTPFEESPEEIDLYVLGLQEIVDVSSPAEALRPYVDTAPSNRWKEAVHKALPPGYQLVSEVQLIGLLLLVYASPAIKDSVSSISSTNVGTGLMGYMGNKGAVATRLVLGETTRLVFINCHLAAGSDKGSLERRNWDASQISERVKFTPADHEHGPLDGAADSIGRGDFAFWFGDLNYRLDDIPGDSVRQVLARHTANSYDTELQEKHNKSGSHDDSQADSRDQKPPPAQIASEGTDPDGGIDPHVDPGSLQTTISSLLAHDQLQLQKRKGAVFHKGWREGEITFLPTYKYDVGSVAMFDSSEKSRAPGWCDRILFRTRRDKLKHEQLKQEAEAARKRDEEMKARGLDNAAADENVLFEYDPETDGANSGDEYASDGDQASDDVSRGSQDFEDPIRLDRYISHQGILTSDHKPLDAVFTLTFDAVNPQLKAKVHHEVVRELDKAENEARPSLTVVVDSHGDQDRDSNAVDFSDVAFDVPVHRSLTIANTSGASATFSFGEPPSLNDDDSQSEIPSWLDLHIEKPPEDLSKHQLIGSTGRHTLLPGEVANVEMTARVRDITHVRLLNVQKVKLEQVLVLHVEGGRDHFILATGNWLPTCFGCSVAELTRMPEAGARSLHSVGVSHPPKNETEVRLSAPRELFRLTESISELAERAVAEWSMTKGDSEDRAPWTVDPQGIAWPFQPDAWTLQHADERAPLLALVREALDTNQTLTSGFAPEIPSLHRLEILSETLLTFLNSLSDGIVTASVWQHMEQQMIAREKAKHQPQSWEEWQAWVLENLANSPAHSVSFTFVTFMLARIANEVTPVPSTTIPPQSSSAKTRSKHHKSSESTTDSTQSHNQTETQQHSQPPTPASAAAFISAGSFRRKPRSETSTSSSGSDSATNTTATAAAKKAAIAHRQSVESALASVFSRVLISAAVPTPIKEKERRAADERKRSIVEPFLKMLGVDASGPSGGGRA